MPARFACTIAFEYLAYKQIVQWPVDPKVCVNETKSKHDNHLQEAYHIQKDTRWPFAGIMWPKARTSVGWNPHYQQQVHQGHGKQRPQKTRNRACQHASEKNEAQWISALIDCTKANRNIAQSAQHPSPLW